MITLIKNDKKKQQQGFQIFCTGIEPSEIGDVPPPPPPSDWFEKENSSSWYYSPTPPLGQDMTQGQFVSGV